MTGSVIRLVEDDPNDEMLARRALRKIAPVEVVVARDGAEALEYLFATGAFADRPPDLPRLVLLDLKIPKVDGLEVLRRLRADERTRTLPVVILTSSCEPRDITAGYASGANSYVRKPVDAVEFGDAVSRVVAYWLELNESPIRS